MWWATGLSKANMTGLKQSSRYVVDEQGALFAESRIFESGSEKCKLSPEKGAPLPARPSMSDSAC